MGIMNNKNLPCCATQRGSALFMILMAVALFAALAFTFSRGIQQGNDNLSQRQADLAASDILNYAARSERGVNVMLQKRGRSEVDLNFDGLDGGYTNTFCSSDACKFFSPQGGGGLPVYPLPRWLDSALSDEDFFGTWYVSARFCIKDVGASSVCTGSDGTDLMMILPYLQERICLRINEKLGIDAPIPVIAAPGSINAAGQFNGSFSPGNQVLWDDASINGRSAGCFFDDSIDGYHFYQVLIAR
jgi:hypothetical protein